MLQKHSEFAILLAFARRHRLRERSPLFRYSKSSLASQYSQAYEALALLRSVEVVCLPSR